MKNSYLNDGFFGRLETLALNMKADLRGFFGGKHLVRTYGQTVEFADYREYIFQHVIGIKKRHSGQYGKSFCRRCFTRMFDSAKRNVFPGQYIHNQ